MNNNFLDKTMITMIYNSINQQQLLYFDWFLEV